MVLRILPNRADDIEIFEGVHGHRIICVVKIKKGNKEKKERVSKQKL